MKRTCLPVFIFALLLTACEKEDTDTNCKDRYYYYHSEKIPLTEIPNQASVSFYDTLSAETIQQRIGQFQEMNILSIPANNKYAIVSIHSGNCSETDKLLAAVKNDSAISNCNKFFVTEEGYTLGISDVFVCKVKSGTTQNQWMELIPANKVEIIKSNASGGHYTIRADKHSEGDALDMANTFFESNFFEYAEPEFIVSYGTYE